jgi:hypothetical protein
LTEAIYYAPTTPGEQMAIAIAPWPRPDQGMDPAKVPLTPASSYNKFKNKVFLYNFTQGRYFLCNHAIHHLKMEAVCSSEIATLHLIAW